MSDFRYLPFPLPADATLTLTTTITRDPSTPTPTASTSFSTNSLQSPSQTLSITTITLRVTETPSDSSSILSTAISSSSTPTPTPTPSGPAHKPTVHGDITPTFYIVALMPILVMLLCTYESYTHRKIYSKQAKRPTTVVPRNDPNGDIELQDLSTGPVAPLRQYWWFEADTVTDQVSTDTDDRGVPYNSLCHPRPPLPLPSLWTSSWWPYSRGSGRGRSHGTLPGWGRRHTFSEYGSYPSTFDPSRPRLGLKFEPFNQEVKRRGQDGGEGGGGEVYSRRLIVGRDSNGVIQIVIPAETNLVPSRPSTPDWLAGIPSYYNNGRSPTFNYSSSVSSCSSTSKGKAKASSSNSGGNRNRYEPTTAAVATGSGLGTGRTTTTTTTTATSRRPRNVAAGEGSSSSTDASQSAAEAPKNLPPRCDTCKTWPLIEWPRLCTSCGQVV
ncbi:hypothetical protein CcaCcLH18_06729 [Colletotrichum camelliae]|nr:hypothetical protein CcaCcLH18_06729 [Colletotrichum camelliae]